MLRRKKKTRVIANQEKVFGRAKDLCMVFIRTAAWISDLDVCQTDGGSGRDGFHRHSACAIWL